jgi:hypothetical protein
MSSLADITFQSKIDEDYRIISHPGAELGFAACTGRARETKKMVPKGGLDPLLFY